MFCSFPMMLHHSRQNSYFHEIIKFIFIFSDKGITRDNIPLVLPTLKIDNILLKRVDHIESLGVLFDENLTWKNHVYLIENKISKSLGILHRANFLLNRKSRKNVYFSFIHGSVTKLVFMSDRHFDTLRPYQNHLNTCW